MHTQVYNTREWRRLPRTDCAVSQLLGEHAGPCRGLIHRHHVDPDDPFSRTVTVCNRHHGKLHALIDSVAPRPRRCPHRHTSRAAREQCERRLNQAA